MASNETSKYKLSVVDGTELQLSLNGATGATGPANVLTIGTVTTGETGVSAAATITGSSPSQVLNLTLPKGNTGTAATIAAGTTTTGAAGSSASVTNAGTSGAAVFNFTIPRGDTGNTGATGPANTLSIGTVGTGASPSVTITGTSPNQTLNFVLQKGDKGNTGDTGPQGPTGLSSTAFEYVAKTTSTSGDPLSSFITWNQATQVNATVLNVSHIAADGDDYDVFLALLKPNDFIIIQSRANSDKYQKFLITGTPTIVTNSYVQIPVANDSYGTSPKNFANNDTLLFIIQAVGPTGPTGPSNTLSIGTVTAGGIGVASATITGTSPNQTLNLVMPTGATGATGNTGAAATIAVGTTTTGAAGSSASVTNVGTSGAAVFDFTIPRGDTGATGPANTLTVASTTTGNAGTSAAVTIAGTSPNQSLSFTIPRGDTGAEGPTGPEPSLTIGDNANTSITLADADNNTVVRCTAATAVTLTVPSTLAAGFSCMVIQSGAGQITVTAGAGTTLNSFGALVKTAGLHAPASIIRVAAATYNLSGNLV